MHGEALVVMAKSPEPGAVKTRLGLLPGEAAALYTAFLQDLLHNHRHQTYDLILAVSPPEAQERLGESFRIDRTIPQQGKDFGERLSSVFLTTLKEFQRVVVIGSDSPQIDPSLVQSAMQTLAESDVVLGPTFDGGYYLVGLAASQPLFDEISWSTSEVLEQTLRRVAMLDLKVRLLPKLHDIDTLGDLKACLSELSSDTTPATAQAIRQLQRRYPLLLEAARR